MLFLIWIGCIAASAVIAMRKNLSVVGFSFLALFLGPLALLIVLLVPAYTPLSKRSEGIASLTDAQSRLQDIKNTLSGLQAKVSSLEAYLTKSLGKEIPQATQAPEKPLESYREKAEVTQGGKENVIFQEVISHEYEEVTASLQKKDEQDGSFEFTFGKYWLSRAGVMLFVLGVIFFISYSFKYLSPLVKIAMGYFVSLGFFIWGNALEKNKKYLRIAWGILGGAWALLYVSTYAMHYIEQVRVIKDSTIAVFLLGIVSFCAVIYNLKYRSWVVTALTYLFAFITAGLGGIEYSSVVYCAFLTASIAYLACKLDWHTFLLCGMAGVYLIYMYWLYPQIASSPLASREFSVAVYQFFLSFGILSVSWLLFSSALFLLKVDNEKQLRAAVTGALCNAAFFVILGLSAIEYVRPHLAISPALSKDACFWFLIGLSGIYALYSFLYIMFKKSSLTVANASITFSLLAMAIMLKVPRLGVGFFWLLEMCLLFALGIYYSEFIYRALAVCLSIVIGLRLFAVDFFSQKYYMVFGMQIHHASAIFGFAALCFFVLGALTKNKEIDMRLQDEEKSLFHAFIAFASVLGMCVLGKEVNERWLSLAWAVEGIGILGAGLFLRHKVYRISALAVISFACLKVFFVDMEGVNTIYKIAAFIVMGAILLAVSMVYAKFVPKEKTEYEKAK
ncbi:MAG: hypothetical protein A2Y00_09055 [Omnitrophica WOR_2 bacterium GWF2_43_52]|nr:MAG: hypothetical protein A2062_02900 [Omnitrophica WOR_2 bacterium GWA2_44_7]OGX21711.1 MAG: hypothetical protein A2Y00_09055 [Omnitrophica WOR_2 bacterium GWF2_43_52]HAH19961.1 hypothetical protein [Candidatus Omnitrophota bacterium]HBG63126.1 hypothetical protein [Candidatus Omnitrophota bacterium]